MQMKCHERDNGQGKCRGAGQGDDPGPVRSGPAVPRGGSIAGGTSLGTAGDQVSRLGGPSPASARAARCAFAAAALLG